MKERLRLTLSPEKTCVTHVDDGLDLLGFRVKRASWRGKKRVAYTFPSQRALREVMDRIKTLTNRSTLNLSLDELIHALNPILHGWANYDRHAAKQPLFRVSQPLPVVARDPLAAQEVPAADLQTDQATVLGAPLDQPRRHEASLARRGPRDPIPLSRSPDPLAVGGHRNRPSHHPAANRRRMTTTSRSTIASRVESRMLGNGHVRFAGRVRETDRR